MRNPTSRLRDLLLSWSIALCRSPRRWSGQSLIEGALVIVVLALVLIPVTRMLQEGLVAAYLVHNAALNVAATTATVTATAVR